MALRSRKRVFADFRRAPDGSAFQKCESCGVSIAVALADMHVCEAKIKRAKPQFPTEICKTVKLEQQPRSAFLFFREKFAKTCEDENIVDIDKRACIVWKNMSFRERFPYVNQSETLDAAYTKALLQESSGLEQDDDEADSKNSFQRRRLYDHECCAACSAKNDNIFF
ncbi:hypothetical protein V2J09_017590 [Rumex salicifolius]